MDPLMRKACADAAQGVAGAVLAAAGEEMLKHGEDPASEAIIATGFVLAIRAMREDLPSAYRTILELLSRTDDQPKERT